jgi:hypothetical protein
MQTRHWFIAVSKKKFAQLARVFTRKGKRGGVGSSGTKGILNQGTAPARDNLQLNTVPLLEEEDDEEFDEILRKERLGKE